MTLWFQKWYEELCEHRLEHSKVWKVVHWWAFFVKNIMYVSARPFQRNYVSRHWRKLIHDLRNDIRYLVNFHASSRKSRNLYFDEFLLSKVYKDLDENVQRSYVSWHWRVMQSLKKNRFVISKMIRIWWILIRALKILKKLQFLHFDLSLWLVTCSLKNDMTNLENFHRSTWKSLWWDLLAKVEKKLKIYKEVICHGNEERCKIWREKNFLV